MCTNWLTDCSLSPWETFTRTETSPLPGKCSEFGSKLGTDMAIKQGGVFFIVPKSTAVSTSQPKDQWLLLPLSYAWWRNMWRLTTIILHLTRHRERDLNSVSPNHEIELQRSVLSDEYQNYQAKNFPTKVSSCFQQVLVALIKINRIFVNQT